MTDLAKRVAAIRDLAAIRDRPVSPPTWGMVDALLREIDGLRAELADARPGPRRKR